jgi:molybdopterin/thiamine biosynthesis adenylyltransferase/rhodanese-related sulfurtransferase
MQLSQNEIARYSRQILMPAFGLAGQEKLKSSSVLVIGCGGLGSPVLLYLVAAGVGKVGIVDNDVVDVSNLQRQILFVENEVGKSKVMTASNKLKELNQNVIIENYPSRITSFNAMEIVEKYDLVVDCSDNFQTRYLVNDVCEILNRPFVYGAIHQFEGQVSVFNYNGGCTYRDLFSSPPPEEMAPNCATSGVLGMMAGIVGSLQATEAVKVLTGIGEVLSGKLLLIEALTMNFRKIKIVRNPDRSTITELIDYEAFCGQNNFKLESISLANFKALAEHEVQLIDVREKVEYEVRNLGGELMPLAEIEKFVPQIRKDKTVVIYCQSGVRSRQAIELLQTKYGLDNLLNLEGGINAADS